MADIFVSYRRDDSQWSAGRINDRLVADFGAKRVFFDTITIEPGEDFVEVIGAKVGACRVLLTVMGPRWLEILESRLADPNDFVRIEIAEALRRGVRVVPVLIDGASPPPEARLPEDLRPLARRNAIWVRAQTFPSDAGALVEFLRRHLDGASTGSDPGARAPGAIRMVAGSGADDREQWIVPGSGKTVWFKDHPQGPEMVVVPAGEFMMGSPESEPEREPKFGGKEKQRRVTIAQPFAVGRSAVTRGEFAAFVQASGHKVPDEAWTFENEKLELRKGRSWRNPGFAQDDSHPVVCINWDDAKAYTNWLAATTGKPYRLPSEAEWEYVTRAGTTTPFWWGSSITLAQANYDGNFVYAGGGRTGAYRKATLPAAYAEESFEPNPWGLHQVHGNVWEWCEDCWNEGLPPAPADGSALTTGDCERRVVRGGSWFSLPRALRAAVRVGGERHDRINYSGFRVVR